MRGGSVTDAGHEAAVIGKYVRELDLPAVIDVHTHFMPDRVMRKVWAYFDQMAGRPQPWVITYRYDEATRLDILRSFGVQAFTSLVYPHKPDMAQWLNDWATEFAARTPDCLHTATFYPEPSAATYVPAAIDGGARVFKAHVQVGGYDPNDALLEPVWSVIEDRHIPTVIHAGSGPEPGHHTGPEPIKTLLRRHPNLVLIIAHMGLPEYADFMDIAERYDNVRLDTTMVFTDYMEATSPFPVTERSRLSALGERILFGSDYPNIPHPYAHAIQALVELDLGHDWLRGVFYHNARALFAPAKGAGVHRDGSCRGV
jgi:uncharacterized protein